MTIRTALSAFMAAVLLLPGCTERPSGPIGVSAIGGEAELVNPNLEPLDAPRALMLQAVAQGLVRFDATGEIEPALAQSWIISDDGLRYTFRLHRTNWSDGSPVVARQVASRLQAAISNASSNALKPSLRVIQDIEAMTDQVLEISLTAPRPHFLQFLAQPELAILMRESGTGPYRAQPGPSGAILLTTGAEGKEEQPDDAQLPSILLRAEPAPLAVARFASGGADLVVGGTAGDLPIARAAGAAADSLVFDPAAGLFGLVFDSSQGPASEVEFRRALTMAIDRDAIVAALAVPDLRPRMSLAPPDLADLPQPAAPDWAASPLAMRRELATRTIEEISEGERIPIRVAMPEGPGYRLIFGYLRRDWSAVGVDAEMVAPDAEADLRFVDRVAPAGMAAWYLRQFTCEQSRICSEEADRLIDAARDAPVATNRAGLLAEANRLLTELAPFVPIAAPVRWSLVSSRLTGFRPNVVARHPPSEYIAETP